MGSFLKVVLLLTISFSCFGNVSMVTETLCIPDSPPYSGTSLPNNGPLAELVVNALKLANIKVELTFPPWARIIKEASNGHCMIAGLWPTAQRKELFYFSEKPIIKQSLGLYISKDRNIEDITNGLMAVQRSTYLSNKISRNDWRFYEVRSIAQGAQMLARSRVDVLYAEVGRMNYMMINDPQLAENIKLTSPIIEQVYGYLAISKKHKNAKEIMAIFNNKAEQALTTMKKSTAQYLDLNG